MGRGPPLSDEEGGRIKGLHEASFSVRETARRVGRSAGAVQRVLDGHTTERKKPGPPAAMTEREVRLLVRTAATGNYSARQLKHELKLVASVRSIQRALADVDWLVYTKMDNTLPLTAQDKATRRDWAWEMLMHKGGVELWDTIIFSDEKKWNLDGPDDFQHYWRDLRLPPRQTKRQQAGSGSVMVWAAFSATGKTKFAILHGKQRSEDYIFTVSEYLLPFAHLHYGLDFIYQQDGAPIHTSKCTKAFLDEQQIRVLDWPARSPDLNPIENSWSIMTRHVYSNGRQYDSVGELTVALFDAWNSIETSVLRTLIDSMPRRCREVIEKRNNKTHY